MGVIHTAFGSIDETALPLHVRHIFFKHVHAIAGIDTFSSEVEECKDRFNITYPLDLRYMQEQRDDIGVLVNDQCFSPNTIVDVETYNDSIKRQGGCKLGNDYVPCTRKRKILEYTLF